VPTYTIPQGLDSDFVPYSQSDAVAAAADDVQSDPLTVFVSPRRTTLNLPVARHLPRISLQPADADTPINSAGEDTTSTSKRNIGFERRAACDAKTTIPNFYNVDVSSYANFKADATIASVALNAATPAGYLNNFKNAPGANNAYAYLGYAIVNKGKTGYDTQWCANKCNSISGCRKSIPSIAALSANRSLTN
jgi:hypothetical protein